LRIKKLKTTTLLAVMFTSIILFTKLPTAKAEFGKAEVYIISLPDAGACWIDNKSEAVEGSIDAISSAKR